MRSCRCVSQETCSVREDVPASTRQSCFCCVKTGTAVLFERLCFFILRRCEMEESVKEQELSSKEKCLIKLIRETGYGSLTVFIQNGVPVRVEQIKESIQLK